MSTLSALLSGDLPPAVFRWTGGDLPEESLHGHDWHHAHLHGEGVDSKATVLAAIGTALDFPDWYGQNYDALWDCLRDIPVPMLVVWDHWATLAEADRAAFDMMLRILGLRADDEDGLGAFAVVLVGDGPDPGLPTLS